MADLHTDLYILSDTLACWYLYRWHSGWSVTLFILFGLFISTFLAALLDLCRHNVL